MPSTPVFGRGAQVATTRWLNVEFSSKCVLRCKWCSLDHDKEPVFLGKDVFVRLMDEVVDSGHFELEQIDLHNAGETLLHPDIGGMLAVIAEKRRRGAKLPSINLLTNAVLLNEKMSRTILDSGAVDLLRFSVDGGSPEAFEEFRRPAKWERVSANIRRFIELNRGFGKKVRTGVICIVPPERPKNTGWMEASFRDLIESVDGYVIRHPHNWDGSADLGLDDDRLRRYERKNRGRLCKFLVKNLVVLPDASVTVCCADLNARGVIGSLNNRTLFELYGSAERNAMLSLYREGRKHEIELCRACTGYHEGLLSRLHNLLRKV